MIPGILIIIPFFVIISKMHLADTLTSLIITYSTFALPFCIWILRGFFDSIPIELEECAMIDGCTRIGALLKISLPLAAPGIAATATLVFIFAFSEYMFALIFINTETTKTLSLGIAGLLGQWNPQWAHLMAFTMCMLIPIIVLFMFLQKYLVQGLTAGAVKG
jgi:ABC-type glycerol-3-phosphate transport system permease component